MADNLRDAIDKVVAGLISLAADIDANDDPVVDESIAPQLKFFTAVQKRAAELQADVAAGKKRLGTRRLGGWAGAMMVQAAQDLRDGGMGRSDDVRQVLEDSARTVEGFAKLAEVALKTIPDEE